MIPKDTYRTVRVHLNRALYADLQDAATERHTNVPAEIHRRCLINAPGTRDVPVKGWLEPTWEQRYEGRYPIDVLRMRTEPEDFGPRIELWRAERSVSRPWLAQKLEIKTEALRYWEAGWYEFTEDEKKRLLETLAELDKFYPELKDRIPPINPNPNITMTPAQIEAAELDKMCEDPDQWIEWVPGSTTYAENI